MLSQLRFRFVGFVVCTVLVTTALAQSSPVPVEQEPRHKTVFLDASIRVLEIRIPPGDESLMHSHHHDGVHITVQGARISETKPRGWWSSTHAASAPGLTYYSALNGDSYTHQIKNIDTVATHVIAVELLSAASLAPKPIAQLPYSEKIADNTRVNVGRIRLEPNAKLQLPELPARVLLVGLSAHTARLGDKNLRLQPGSVHSIEAAPAQALASGEGSPLELIAIQFK